MQDSEIDDLKMEIRYRNSHVIAKQRKLPAFPVQYISAIGQNMKIHGSPMSYENLA